MPLPAPAPRAPVHDRTIECRGYRRDDGLWDIEAHLIDTKHFGFANRHRGRIEAGEPIHEMWVRLTLDQDMRVHEACAVTDAAPFAPCPQAAAGFAALAGLRIGPGWRREVRRLLGGTAGCTHLAELLGPVATTAVQTLFAARHEDAHAGPDGERPAFLDSCLALASDGPVVREHWPRFYCGPAADAPR